VSGLFVHQKPSFAGHASFLSPSIHGNDGFAGQSLVFRSSVHAKGRFPGQSKSFRSRRAATTPSRREGRCSRWRGRACKRRWRR
jgi:hypothetical protein